MKKYKVYTTILIILILLVLTALGLYIFKKDTVKSWLNLKEANVVTQEPKVEEPKKEETPTRIDKIITLGTGMKRPSQYKPSEQYYIIDNRKYELDTLVNSLKNEELKKEINTFIKESTEKIENKRSDFQQYIEEGNKEREKNEWAGNKLDYYRVISTNLNSGDESDPIQIFTEWKCTNG